MGAEYHSLAGSAFRQDWTNTGQITTNDSWTGVLSIVGYRGDNITPADGVDPRTLTGDGTVTVDVNANQTNPTFTTGGVTEFELTDPTIALAGSGTADAPHIVIHLDATGRRDVSVSYRLRDLENGTDNAVQQVALQYRLGASGTWTDVPAGYVADATTGPSTAGPDTNVSAVLPSAVDGQPNVQVRIITTNAVGNDEWVGIDDIVVDSASAGGTASATVSIGDAAVVEGDAGTKLLTFTVTRSNADTAFSVDYATGDGTALNSEDYTGATGTLAFAANGALTQTFAVTIRGDTAVEPDETFAVTLSNVQPTSGTTTIADGAATGTIRNDDVANLTAIHDIQGPAFFSPILAADGITTYNTASTTQVTVRAVVTATTATGFYITEEADDWDISALTSEGIFVRTSATAGLTLGETVTVTASVMEAQNNTNPSRTILVNPTILQSDDSVTLPTLVIDGTSRRIPNAQISADRPDYLDSDGSSGTFNPDRDALDFFESVEGMRVTLGSVVVGDGFVAGGNNTARFFAYSADSADPALINSRGGLTVFGDPQFYPVDTPTPDDDVDTGGRTAIDAITGNFVEVDFSNAASGGSAAFHNQLTMGDQLGDVTGVIDFDFNVVKFFVTEALAPSIVSGISSTTPIQEVTALAGDDRSLRIATFNVENLSPVGTTFSGTQTTGQDKFDALAQNVAVNLKSPDIIVVEEVQDNNGTTADDVVEANQTWEALVAAVNAATGRAYQWVDEAPEESGTVGGAPGGNIRVGFLYDTGRVTLGNLAANAALADRRAFTDRIGDGVATAGDRIAVNDAGLGIDPADWAGTRRSIVGEFVFNGQTVHVFGSHLPSKGGSGTLINNALDPDAGSPANGGWEDRVKLAADLYSVQARAAATGEGHVVSGGDFNEFWFYRPLEVAAGYANEDGTANAAGVKFANLMIEELAAAERFSYDFDGRSQALDTLLASGGLASVASYDVVHINTGYNSRTGAADPSTSDHDPGLASFDFRGFGETLGGGTGSDTIQGLGGDDRIGGGDGNDVLEGGVGDDVLIGGDGADRLDGGADNDIVSYTVTGDRVFVNLQTGSGGAAATGDTYVSIEGVIGSGFADAITGNASTRTIDGRDGNDRINIVVAPVRIDGGTGTDALYVRDAAQIVFTTASLAGIETIVVDQGGSVDVSAFVSPTRFTLQATGTGLDTTVLVGGQGADTLSAAAGAAVLDGQGGDDRVTINGANVAVDGGEGRDQLFVRGASVTFTDDSYAGFEVVAVAQGANLDLSAVSAVYDAADVAVGTAIRLSSTAGNTMRVAGTQGDDTVIGGAGNDTIVGALGGDNMRGGVGADTFGFLSTADFAGDRVTDFTRAQGDVIDLGSLDADAGVAGMQHFSFIGSTAFSGDDALYEVRVQKASGRNQFLQFDLDHDGVADSSILVVSATTVNAGDLNLDQFAM